ncbi:MAG: phage portal protein [Clostridium sp.]|nr:phage portal protein [Clostridium sp.]
MEMNVNEVNVKTAEAEFKRDIEKEFSVMGVSVVGGIPNNYDYDKALQGDRALKVYKEMGDNDSTTAALLITIEMLFRRIGWIIDLPHDVRGIEEAEAQREFIHEVLFQDMDSTFDDIVSNIMSMLQYGYSIFEVVYKIRDKKNSLFPDKKLGVKKISFMPQDTRYRWDIKNDGTILAFEQQAPDTGKIITVPYSKCLHFKCKSANGNPEGKSILRGAYRPWYFLKRTQDYEAIGVERELNGVPVIRVPDSLIKSAFNGDESAATALEAYKKIARDLKANSQAGVVIPSDVYQDTEGKPSSNKKVDVELLSNRGTRAIDTDRIIQRYQQDIARSVIASFIMLGGSERGSFALAESQTSLFLAAIEAWTEVIANEFNRKLIPFLISVNGMNTDYMPYIRPGELQPQTFDNLASSIMKLAQAGMPLFPDSVLENYLREKGGLPLLDPEYNGQIPQGYADKVNRTNYQDADETGGDRQLNESPKGSDKNLEQKKTVNE